MTFSLRMRRNLKQRDIPSADQAFNSARHRQLIRALLRWYTRHGRHLPWRNTSDPYRILVSEIMLQQTQVSRVLDRYPLFLRRFPTIRSLARSPQRDVVVAWQGMGYNNRAVRLHRLARIVVHQYRGRLPADADALLNLPGIGRYTAHAILAAAFRQQVAVVDVNVRRFLSRFFWAMPTVAAVRKAGEIWVVATRLVPRGTAYQWNQALMDIGATVCTAHRPLCTRCPVARGCSSRTSMLRAAVHPLRREASLDGVPNRIYRGRIIQELSRSNGRARTRADILGRRIYPRFTRRHDRWLSGLLASLQRDGLVVLHGNGSLSTRHVSLA